MNKELNINLKAYIESNNLYVSFRRIISPFATHRPGIYPVNNYYIIVVKYEKRNVFDIANAENLYLKGENLYEARFGIELKEYPYVFDKPFYILGINDSDGDEIDVDKKYVIFIYALYNVFYKKSINNFEDFLSNPEQITTFN